MGEENQGTCLDAHDARVFAEDILQTARERAIVPGPTLDPVDERDAGVVVRRDERGTGKEHTLRLPRGRNESDVLHEEIAEVGVQGSEPHIVQLLRHRLGGKHNAMRVIARHENDLLAVHVELVLNVGELHGAHPRVRTELQSGRNTGVGRGIHGVVDGLFRLGGDIRAALLTLGIGMVLAHISLLLGIGMPLDCSP